MLKCFVVGGGLSEEAALRDMGFDYTRNIYHANSLWFTGGADIPPSLYGQRNVASGGSPYHDEEDLAGWKYFEENRAQFTMLLGACRGGQFLNAMSGGNMWQDVNNHHGRHEVTDLRTGIKYITNSIHHQMMRPSKDAEIIAVAGNLATKFTDDTGTYTREELEGQLDIEACWYPNTRSVCIQSHPEWDANGTRALFKAIIDEKLPVALELQRLETSKEIA